MPISRSASGQVLLAYATERQLAELRDLEPGDAVSVVDGLGEEHPFEVTAVEEVPKSDLPDALFATSGPRLLALVTCSGPFDEETRHYRDNLVVWAEPAAQDVWDRIKNDEPLTARQTSDAISAGDVPGANESPTSSASASGGPTKSPTATPNGDSAEEAAAAGLCT